MKHYSCSCFLIFLAVMKTQSFATTDPQLLFQDPLDGNPVEGWTIAPSNFEKDKDGSVIYWLDNGATSVAPVVGNNQWRNYCIEYEFLSTGGGWVGVYFNLQEDLQKGCNIQIYIDPSNPQNIFEFAEKHKAMVAWKPFPYGQRFSSLSPNKWYHCRIEVAETFANVYLNHEKDPYFTVYDLPYPSGAIQFMEWHCKGAFKNLKVTKLDPVSIQPILEDSWKSVRNESIIRDWQISDPIQGGDECNDLNFDKLDYVSISKANIDNRGVINIGNHVSEPEKNSIVFAKHAFEAPTEGTRKIKLTYTDRFELYCNGASVFRGPPREWFHPDKAKHGYSRLIPDQYEVEFPVKAGTNTLIVRSQLKEPLFGWAFWMRWA